mmetsp:Transcript_2237/g.14824  ORF Transcript_2237/g.14824 Transcript_2237/m.14824 type:complete len:81 (+) Transcript_2237:1-243(+)
MDSVALVGSTPCRKRSCHRWNARVVEGSLLYCRKMDRISKHQADLQAQDIQTWSCNTVKDPMGLDVAVFATSRVWPRQGS